MYSKKYTVISLTDLPRERELAKQFCALLQKLDADGSEYKLRTFYLGPRGRSRYSRSRPASTPRSNAVAAKIGIYKVQGYYNDANWSGQSRRRPYMALQGYV